MTTIMIMTMVTMTLISMLPNIMIYFEDQDEDQRYDGSDGHGHAENDVDPGSIGGSIRCSDRPRIRAYHIPSL